MDERDEALEYLEDLIPEKVEKTIMEKTGINDFYLDVDESYQQYEDFDGNIKAYITSNNDDSVIGEMEFLIVQKSFTLSELDDLMDASFDDFVDEAKFIGYVIWLKKEKDNASK
jgi:hypothetical protein